MLSISSNINSMINAGGSPEGMSARGEMPQSLPGQQSALNVSQMQIHVRTGLIGMSASIA